MNGFNLLIIFIENRIFFKGYKGLTGKILGSLKPKVVLTRNKDGSYSFSSNTSIIKTNYRFVPDEEYDEVGIKRDRVRSVVSFRGNTMVHVQKGVFV